MPINRLGRVIGRGYDLFKEHLTSAKEYQYTDRQRRMYNRNFNMRGAY